VRDLGYEELSELGRIGVGKPHPLTPPSLEQGQHCPGEGKQSKAVRNMYFIKVYTTELELFRLVIPL